MFLERAKKPLLYFLGIVVLYKTGTFVAAKYYQKQNRSSHSSQATSKD